MTLLCHPKLACHGDMPWIQDPETICIDSSSQATGWNDKSNKDWYLGVD